MNAHPDFTERRGRGLYEHEVVNVFRLATPAPKEIEERIDIARILREERGNIKDKIRELLLEPDYGPGGHTAGWNAAIEAVLRKI